MENEIIKFIPQTPYKIILNRMDLPDGDITSQFEIESIANVLSAKLQLRQLQSMGYKIVVVDPYEGSRKSKWSANGVRTDSVVELSLACLDIIGALLKGDLSSGLAISEILVNLSSVGVFLDNIAIEKARELIDRESPFIAVQIESDEAPLWVYVP